MDQNGKNDEKENEENRNDKSKTNSELSDISSVASLITSILTILSSLFSDKRSAGLTLCSIGIVCLILTRLSFKKTKKLAIVSIGLALISLTLFCLPTLKGCENGTDNNTEETSFATDSSTGSGVVLDYGIGDIISFGSYEQDNNIENGTEDLKWKVLDRKNNEILIITTSAIDCQPYNAIKTNVTWESCSLRKWLNGTFYNAAFSAEEQNQILTTYVTADPNPQFSTDPGADTYDKVFALSLYEVERYLPSDSSRQCNPTAYTVGSGAYQNSQGNCWWWLRSPGEESHDAASVNSDGTIDYDDGTVNSTRGAVRPAMWISLEQENS